MALPQCQKGIIQGVNFFQLRTTEACVQCLWHQGQQALYGIYHLGNHAVANTESAVRHDAGESPQRDLALGQLGLQQSFERQHGERPVDENQTAPQLVLSEVREEHVGLFCPRAIDTIHRAKAFLLRFLIQFLQDFESRVTAHEWDIKHFAGTTGHHQGLIQSL